MCIGGQRDRAHGDPIDAFDYLTLAIRHYHDAGNVTMIQNPLAILAPCYSTASDTTNRPRPSAGSPQPR